MRPRKKLVLLVDDYKDVRDLYAQFLTHKGYSVEVAGTGQEGLDKTVELHPDLIVMDYSLPDIGGWEVTQRLKKDKRTRRIPVFLLTAYDFVSSTPHFKELCDGILIKPCLPDALLAEIERVLGRRGAKIERPASR